MPSYLSLDRTAFPLDGITELCCATLRLCFSPLVALWPVPNLWVTPLRHHAIWGSPFSRLINHNTRIQAAGSSSFCGCYCIVSSTSIFPSYSFFPTFFFSLHAPFKFQFWWVCGHNTWQIKVTHILRPQQINITDARVIITTLTFALSLKTMICLQGFNVSLSKS